MRPRRWRDCGGAYGLGHVCRIHLARVPQNTPFPDNRACRRGRSEIRFPAQHRRSLMTRAYALIFATLVYANLAFGQVQTLTIPAGSPEDKDLTAITAEPDNQKQISMYQDYIQKYSANNTAVAYANWQLAQSYQAAGDLLKALEAGDQASAAAPHSLDILVSQVTIAQQLKNNPAAFKY